MTAVFSLQTHTNPNTCAQHKCYALTQHWTWTGTWSSWVTVGLSSTLKDLPVIHTPQHLQISFNDYCLLQWWKPRTNLTKIQHNISSLYVLVLKSWLWSTVLCIFQNPGSVWTKYKSLQQGRITVSRTAVYGALMGNEALSHYWKIVTYKASKQYSLISLGLDVLDFTIFLCMMNFTNSSFKLNNQFVVLWLSLN